MASPIGDTGTGLGIGPGLGRVPHDLDPQQAVGEVTVVESEGEIGVRRRRDGAREVGVHDRISRVEEIRIIQILHNAKKPTQPHRKVKPTQS